MQTEELDNFYIMRPMEVGFIGDTPFRMCGEDDPILILWNRVVEKLCKTYEHKKEIGIKYGPPAFHCRFSHFFGVENGILQTIYMENGQMPYIDGFEPIDLKEIDNLIKI